MIGRNFQQAIWQNNLPTNPPSASAWGGANGTLVADTTTSLGLGGVWEVLLTATYDIYGFWLGITATSSSGAQTDMMLDIALGASQENVIIPELLCGWIITPGTGGGRWTYFPIFIPKGSVVSGRIRGFIVSDTADVLIHANGGASGQPGPLFSGCDAYGTNGSASQGTSVTPGNSGAEGAAVAMGGTLTKNYGAVLFLAQGTMSNITMTSVAYHWEVLAGTTVLCEYNGFSTTSEYMTGPFPPTPFYTSLPSGTQLNVQGECSGTAQTIDTALYCFY